MLRTYVCVRNESYAYAMGYEIVNIRITGSNCMLLISALLCRFKAVAIYINW